MARRLHGERGYCGLTGLGGKFYRCGVQVGEEIALSPSYIVDFSACSLNCPYCSEWERLQVSAARFEKSPEELAEHIVRHRFKSIQFIGGEPMLSLPYLYELSLMLKELTSAPIYINTNGYFNEESLEIANHFASGWIFDLKHESSCLSALRFPPDYTEVVKRNIEEAARSQAEVYVRHLLVPGHIECCSAPIFSYLCDKDVIVNAMSAFVDFRGDFGDATESERRAFVDLYCRYARSGRDLLNGSIVSL